MDFLQDITRDTILIIPNNIKTKVLKYIDQIDRLINIKLMSLEEVKKSLFFDYDHNAILYLMNKYDYKYDVSKKLIDNFYYVEDKKYDNKKLDNLVFLKKELLDNNLLILDNNFSNLIKNKDILVYGYDYLDKFQDKMINALGAKVIVLDEEPKNFQVREFNNVEEEISFVLEQIIDLVQSGIDINKIKLVNVQDYYYNTLIKLKDFYNIPINLSKKTSIFSSVVVRKFLDELDKGLSFEDALSSIKGQNDEIYNILVDLTNKYIHLDYDFSKIKEAIIHDLKNTCLDSPKYKDAVEVINLDNYVVSSDEYIFYLSFNQKEVLKVFKNEDYLDDETKKILDLSTSYELNKLSKNSLINKLNSINHLFITYKLNHIQEEFYPANLISELNMKKLDNKVKDKSYSRLYDSYKLSIMLDDLIKYGQKNNDLGKYYSSFNISFMDFDNAYKKVNYKPEKLTLSYSAIDDYYKCSFKYYLKNILKLNKYEETFDTLVGSLFHFVLSKCFDDNFNFDSCWDYFLKEKTLQENEKFFLVKLKEELKFIVDFCKEFRGETTLKELFLEKKIIIDKSSMIPVDFVGIVDKIMFNHEDIAIIDYKTGNPNTSLNNMIYGLNMQLGVYLYLLYKSNIIDNPNVLGIYFQKILNTEITKSYKESYLDQKRNSLKLIGYSLDDFGLIENFDPTYEQSKYIKGMKTTSKGFGPYTKLINLDQRNNLIKLIDEKIDEARDNILSANFDINPKRIGNDLVGCNFCEYRDICFRKEKDIVNLKEYDDLSFLD